MNGSNIIFGAPCLGEEEIEGVVATLRSGWIGTGPEVAAFEKEFANLKNIPFAIAVSSCTAALHLALLAADIGAGDEVITTPMTFCATVNAIAYTGATPVAVDINPISLNIDLDKLEQAITPRTKALLPVHFAGWPCDMSRVMDIARRHNLLVIEDCAHAIEATFKGQATGTFGDFGCFSFYPTKNITTAEGGMVITRCEETANRLRRLSQHGMSKNAWKRFSDSKAQHYAVTEIGCKYNMIDLHAVIGRHQLRRIENYWQRRAEIWQHYKAEFAHLPMALPRTPPEDARHALHLFTVEIDPNIAGLDRTAFMAAMADKGIGTGIHYLCLAEHPAYQELFGWRPENYPNATLVGRNTVSLPLSPVLSDADVERVVSAVKETLAQLSAGNRAPESAPINV